MVLPQTNGEAGPGSGARSVLVFTVGRLGATTGYTKIKENAVAESAETTVYNYMMLSRLQMDCDYWLGAGNKCDKHLWAGNPRAQVAEMRRLYTLLPETPVWLTTEQLREYEAKMVR